MPNDPYRLPLIVDLTPPGWQQRAACVGEDPELFFPEAKGGRNKGHFLALIDQAQAICDQCSVRTECEEAGRDEGDGIWGGEYRTSTKSTRQMIERIEEGAA